MWPVGKYGLSASAVRSDSVGRSADHSRAIANISVTACKTPGSPPGRSRSRIFQAPARASESVHRCAADSAAPALASSSAGFSINTSSLARAHAAPGCSSAVQATISPYPCRAGGLCASRHRSSSESANSSLHRCELTSSIAAERHSTSLGTSRNTRSRNAISQAVLAEFGKCTMSSTRLHARGSLQRSRYAQSVSCSWSKSFLARWIRMVASSTSKSPTAGSNLSPWPQRMLRAATSCCSSDPSTADAPPRSLSSLSSDASSKSGSASHCVKMAAVPSSIGTCRLISFSTARLAQQRNSSPSNCRATASCNTAITMCASAASAMASNS